MRPLEFLQIDAFSDRPLYGNPAAVVLGADAEIPTTLMQRIAREKNLSETVFVFPPDSPDADYRVRIFTPLNELPFAGHPTIAAAHAVLSEFPDKADALLLRQECGIGIVPVEVRRSPSGTTLVMTQATPLFREVTPDRKTLAALLGCDGQALSPTPLAVVSTGVPWLIVQLESVEAIASLAPEFSGITTLCRELGAVGITVFTRVPGGNGFRLRVRTFAPGEGVPEDPVCGSGNGSVAAYLARYVFPDQEDGNYLAGQGIEIGRDGVVEASWSTENGQLRIRIGGKAAVSARGVIFPGE